MKNQFIPYTQAKMLKDLGFTYGCPFFYDGGFNGKSFPFSLVDFDISDDGEVDEYELYNNFAQYQVSAPSYDLAQEWLWDTNKISISIEPLGNHWLWTREEPKTIKLCTLDKFDSPIIAYRQGILKAIEYLHSQIKK